MRFGFTARSGSTILCVFAAFTGALFPYAASQAQHNHAGVGTVLTWQIPAPLPHSDQKKLPKAPASFLCEIVTRGVVRLTSHRIAPSEFPVIGAQVAQLADFLKNQDRSMLESARFDEEALQTISAELNDPNTLKHGQRLEVHVLPLSDAEQILGQSGQADLEFHRAEAQFGTWLAASSLIAPIIVAAASLQQVLPLEESFVPGSVAALLAWVTAKMIKNSVGINGERLPLRSTPLGAVALGNVLKIADFQELFQETSDQTDHSNWTNYPIGYYQIHPVRSTQFAAGGRKDPSWVSYTLLPDLSDPMNYAAARLVVVRKFTQTQYQED
jgi:hypothetical protein